MSAVRRGRSKGRGRGRGNRNENSNQQEESAKPGPVSKLERTEEKENSAPSRPVATLGLTSYKQVAKISDLRLPKRPGFGTTGRKIDLTANFFELKYKEGDVYQYDVSIEPSCIASVNRTVIERLVQCYEIVFAGHKPVYDGQKNVYTIEPLPIGNKKQDFDITFSTDGQSKERNFKVSIKWVARISLCTLTEALRGISHQIPYQAFHAMDVALRHLPSLRYIPVGRSFFSPPSGHEAVDLGQGRELWRGYHQSIRPAFWKTLINLDITSTTFYKVQPVVDFLNQALDKDFLTKERRELYSHERIKFLKEIKGLKVEVTHLGKQKRKYKVRDLSKEPASEKKFTIDKDGTEVETTVASYFEERYQTRLKYPYLPCLQVGNPERGCFLPMEVCNILSGQRCQKKLTEGQTREVIRHTARPAAARKADIMKIVGKAAFDQDEYSNYFGLEVSSQMTKLKGRVLDPPGIQYAKENKVVPRNGYWDLREKRFHIAREIKNWALLVVGSEKQYQPNIISEFTKKLVTVSSEVGMTLPQSPVCCQYLKDEVRHVAEKFENIVATSPPLDLILVVLFNKTSVYATVKSLGDTLYGIPTQCVQYRNVKRPNKQLLLNLLLKINAKLGGINGFISRECKPERIFERPVIFLGADVTHPPPGDGQFNSIAAVVGSIDSYPMNYSTSIRIQQNRMEIITDLSSMVRELLLAFYKSTRKKPEKIIMYRDGVSEGQFQIVIQHELRAIRDACMKLEKGYEPGITFIVVQKRHHARFFAESDRDKVGKTGNIPAGTAVDTDVCHPFEYDFYLCSHEGIQGTSRPAHYHVLWDDNDIKPDELQKLTYMLCHTYVRCTRSVSIPAPVYYAHLAAFRARFHVDHQRGSSITTASGNSSSRKSVPDTTSKKMDDACKLHAKLFSTIYFA